MQITSPYDGDVLSYPLVIIKGKTRDASVTHVLVSTADAPKSHVRYPLCDGMFKAQYLLQLGTNTVRIWQGYDGKTTGETTKTAAAVATPTVSVEIKLVYKPLPAESPTVRLVYVNARDSDGTFQSPCDDSRENDETAAKQRLLTLGWMLQSATAELLHDQGLPRRTFRLDDTGVHTLTLRDVTVSEAHGMDGVQLFHAIHHALCCEQQQVATETQDENEASSTNDDNNHGNLHRKDDVIHIAVMSFSRFINGKAYGHTALGGSGLALFGGASLFTWPKNTTDICRALTDDSAFDGTKFFDDSANRTAKYGQCAVATTSIGACLHELGHCLSLPHPFRKGADQRAGIMGRGFDYIDSVFVQRPTSRNRPQPHWDRGSAVRLHYHRFLIPSISTTPLQQQQKTQKVAHNTNIVSSTSPSPSPSPLPSQHHKTETTDKTRKPSQHYESLPDAPVFRKQPDGRTHCLSKYGIGHIGYYCNGDNACHDEFLASPPHDFTVPSLQQVRKQCDARGGERITLSAIDVEGHMTEIEFKEDERANEMVTYQCI